MTQLRIARAVGRDGDAAAQAWFMHGFSEVGDLGQADNREAA
jgi:hypothetical protein